MKRDELSDFQLDIIER